MTQPWAQPARDLANLWPRRIRLGRRKRSSADVEGLVSRIRGR
jgi:hypothetical protein